MPSVGIYRPPAARKLEQNADNTTYPHSSPINKVTQTLKTATGRPSQEAAIIQQGEATSPGKQCDSRNRRRRPDMAVYVPRGQRIAQEHQRKLEALSLGEDVELRIESPPFAELNQSEYIGQSKCAPLPNDASLPPISLNNSEISETRTESPVLKEEEKEDSNKNVCQLTDIVQKENIQAASETSNLPEEIVDLCADSSEEEPQLPSEQPVQKNVVIEVKSVPQPSLVPKIDENKSAPVSDIDSKPLRSISKKPAMKLNPDEMDWDSLYDDSGECLDPSLMNELTNAVGKVAIEKPKTKFDDSKQRNIDDEFPHVVEIYNFPVEFKTQDLIMVFSEFKNVGFEIKWVDDTHALGVFSNASIVSEVLDMKHPFVKTRCLSEGSPQSKVKARKCADALTPYTARPDTCAALARRLVTGALGVKLPTQRAEREAERKILREAREKKKLAAKQREEAWEGTFS